MVYKCKMCKGDLVIINEENGLCECDSCGSRQTVACLIGKAGFQSVGVRVIETAAHFDEGIAVLPGGGRFAAHQ